MVNVWFGEARECLVCCVKPLRNGGRYAGRLISHKVQQKCIDKIRKGVTQVNAAGSEM
jgi:hypothetical protein